MRTIFIRTCIAFLVSLSGHAWAANYSDPIDGTFKGVYGDTIAVEVPSLVSKSPVSGQDENGDLSFQLNANTGYRNFNQLTDLKYGDPVRVEYNGDPSAKTKMVASKITKLGSDVVVQPVTVVNTDAAAPIPATQTVITTTTTRVNSQ